MPEELTSEQKKLVEQIFLDPAIFNTTWAHFPFSAFWRTNNFLQRSMSYLFALDTSQDPAKWIPLEVDSQGRLEVSSIAGGIIGNMYAWDGTTWQKVKCDGGGELQVDLASPIPTGNNVIGRLALNTGVNIGSVDVLSLPAITHLLNSFLCYGYDGAVNRPLKTDTDGELQVDVVSSALPTGASTEATLNNVVKKASTPTVFNVPMPLANTEYSQALPPNTKKFFIKLRSQSAELKCRFVSGGNYYTVPAGSTHSEDNLETSATLYFESETPDMVAEILAWV